MSHHRFRVWLACTMACWLSGWTAAAIEVNDANILQAILDESTFSSQDLAQLDVNVDGVVDVADLVAWLQITDMTIANIATLSSEAVEGRNTADISVTLNRNYTGVIGYTLGGSAAPDRELVIDPNQDPGAPLTFPDYVAPSRSLVFNNESVKSFHFTILPDTVYEHIESVTITLLPNEDIYVGPSPTHTVYIRDKAVGSIATFVISLTKSTLRVPGDVATGKGVPPIGQQRILTVNIENKGGGGLGAALIRSRSSGVPDIAPNGKIDDIEGDAGYNAALQRLTLSFEYEEESTVFVNDPPLTAFSFDIGQGNPREFIDMASMGGARPRMLTHKLEIILENINLADRFDPSDITLNGTFKETIEGGFTQSGGAFTYGEASASPVLGVNDAPGGAN